MRRRHLVALLLAGLLACGAGGAALADESCPLSGPVSLMILQSGQKVHELARALGGQPLRRDAKTVVFADGRVITADPAAAGEHLNALGWSRNPIQVVASFAKTRRVPGRRFG